MKKYDAKGKDNFEFEILPAKFGNNGHCFSRDITLLICDLISQNLSTQRPCDYLRKVTILPGLVDLSTAVLEI